MPVREDDEFIKVTSQSEPSWHDLDRSQAEQQMAIKDDHVTVNSFAYHLHIQWT